MDVRCCLPQGIHRPAGAWVLLPTGFLAPVASHLRPSGAYSAKWERAVHEGRRYSATPTAWQGSGHHLFSCTQSEVAPAYGVDGYTVTPEPQQSEHQVAQQDCEGFEGNR